MVTIKTLDVRFRDTPDTRERRVGHIDGHRAQDWERASALGSVRGEARRHPSHPFMGKATNWYINVMSNPEVKITARGRTLRGMVKILDEEGLQETIVLFTKKYGKRNLDNYYPTKDAAVEVPIQE